jgi:CHAT domain-containing protein
MAELSLAEAEVRSGPDPVTAVAALRRSKQRFLATQSRQRLLQMAVLESRLHRRLGNVAQARAELEHGAALVARQQAEIANHVLLPSFVDASWDVFAELVDLEASQGDSAAAIEWLDRGFDVRRQWNGGGSEPALRRVSDSGPVVAYLVREDALWIWVVGDGRVRQRRVPFPEGDLVRAIARLNHVLVRDSTGQSIAAAARHVAAYVWWPVTNGLLPRNVGRIGLVLDPQLQAVPWVLLPWSAAADARVVDVAATAFCPSISSCGMPAARAPAGVVKVAALFAGDAGAGLPALPGARDEAERVARYYGASAVDRATPRAFSEALKNADILHFAGHAAPDERDPGQSALLLATAAFQVEPARLSGLIDGRVRTQVVVLSACRTSSATPRRGEGAMGIAGELLRAGAGHVIATQWDVRDSPASEFMALLHDALSEGDEPWDAVRRAQRAWAGNPGVHPLDWAGYVTLTASRPVPAEAGPEATASPRLENP